MTKQLYKALRESDLTTTRGNGMNKQQFEQVVFMQDESATAALAVLDEQGTDAAANYLAEWYYPGEHEIRSEDASGSEDEREIFPDGFVLTWNPRLGYIGLQRSITG